MYNTILVVRSDENAPLEQVLGSITHYVSQTESHLAVCVGFKASLTVCKCTEGPTLTALINPCYQQLFSAQNVL